MKRLLVVTFLTLILIVLTLASRSPRPVAEKMTGRSLAHRGEIVAPQSEKKHLDAGTLSALEVADRFIENQKKELGFQKHHSLQSVSFRTPLKTVVKYSVHEGEIPLMGLGFEVEVDGQMQVTKFENNYRPLLPGSGGSASAPEFLLERLSPRYEVVENDPSFMTPIYFASAQAAKPELAYILRVRDRAGARRGPQQIIFRASDGQILSRSRSRSEF